MADVWPALNNSSHRVTECPAGSGGKSADVLRIGSGVARFDVYPEPARVVGR